MRVIERVEIHRFRSFKDEVILADEITIFSGVNNSGKSNVLRALNLFFNFQTSYDSPHVFDKDYNQAYTGQAGGTREIIIEIHFLPQGSGALQYGFSIARSFKLDAEGFETIYRSTNQSVNAEIKEGNGKITRQFTRFLNSIEFFYIPAVRDKLFVQHLFHNFERIARDTTGQEISKKVDELSNIIGDRSEEISKEFESFLQLPTKATLSSSKSDIFGAVQVEVWSGLQIRKKVLGSDKPSEIVDVPVNLFSSGDGVLMSYIAYFLAHLCRKDPGKRYIWGFEEPENSLEYSKVHQLAAEFNTKFREYAQIFITTHSPAFIKLRDSAGVTFYRVYIEPNVDPMQPNKRLSRVRTLEAMEVLQQSLFGDVQRITEYELLEKEMGLVELSNDIQNVVDELTAKKQRLNDKESKLKKQLGAIDSTFPTKIFIFEDERREARRFWEKILSDAGLSDVVIFSSGGCTNNQVESHLGFKLRERSGYKPMVFRQIDRDGMNEEQINFLENEHGNIVNGKYPYLLRVLPVNEIENFVITPGDITLLKDEDRERIRNKFDDTAIEKLNELHAKYRGKSGELFKVSNNPNPVMQAMRSEALKEWDKQMPGKDLAASLVGFNAMSKLGSMTSSQYPPELTSYVAKIKSFFEQGIAWRS